MRWKTAGLILAGITLLYAAAVAGLYLAMRMPPERFGAVMSRVPAPALRILPFRPLWMRARAGRLAVGETAADFVLPTAGHTAAVRLSEQWRERPVVLIFGSYT